MWRFTILLQSQIVHCPSKGGLTFPSTSLSIPQPHRGIHLMEVEILWPPATWSDVPFGCNRCWMSGHTCRRLPGMDQACKTILSQVDYKRGQKVWCGGKLVAKCRRQIWQVLLYFYICSWYTSMFSEYVGFLCCINGIIFFSFVHLELPWKKWLQKSWYISVTYTVR